jgi:hypothetical protein
VKLFVIEAMGKRVSMVTISASAIGDAFTASRSKVVPFADKERAGEGQFVQQGGEFVRICVPGTLRCGGRVRGWLFGGAAARQQGCGEGRDQCVFHGDRR